MTSSEQDNAADHVLDDLAAARLTADTIRTNPGGPTPRASGLLDHLADELEDVMASRGAQAEAEHRDTQSDTATGSEPRRPRQRAETEAG